MNVRIRVLVGVRVRVRVRCLRVEDVERLEVVVGDAHARVVLRERLVRVRARARGRVRVGVGVRARVRGLGLTLTLTLTSMIVARRLEEASSGQPISAATSPPW